MLEIRNLDLQLGSRQVFQRLSISLSKGEKIAVTGKSGSGKSSLLHCILGFLNPVSGRIFLQGEELDSGAVWTLRKLIGYVPQEPDLGNSTAREFIQKPFAYRANRDLVWDEDRLQNLCQTFHLSSNLLTLPSKKLSGGEKQRIALISALLLDRELYLLDEITSALDQETRDAVVEYLAGQKTLSAVIVAHDPILQALCDKTYSLQSNDVPGGGVDHE